MKKLRLTPSHIKTKIKKIHYLCGLSAELIDIIIHCLMLYSHIINYPECKGSGVRTLNR